MSLGAHNTSLSAKTEFTNEDRRQMLNLLQTGPNTGSLQTMLMNGGPISADNMAALIAKLRELDTQNQMPEALKDKFNKIEKTIDLFAQKPKDNAPIVKDTLGDFQLKQLLVLNGPTGFAERAGENLLGTKMQAEVAGRLGSESPGPLPQGLDLPGQTLQFGGPPVGKV
jgi:hypothetical protein